MLQRTSNAFYILLHNCNISLFNSIYSLFNVLSY
nr:MAG TPA: hypothetical protein [Caudoviricetes sp.]